MVSTSEGVTKCQSLLIHVGFESSLLTSIERPETICNVNCKPKKGLKLFIFAYGENPKHNEDNQVRHRCAKINGNVGKSVYNSITIEWCCARVLEYSNKALFLFWSDDCWNETMRKTCFGDNNVPNYFVALFFGIPIAKNFCRILHW